MTTTLPPELPAETHKLYRERATGAFAIVFVVLALSVGVFWWFSSESDDTSATQAANALKGAASLCSLRALEAGLEVRVLGGREAVRVRDSALQEFHSDDQIFVRLVLKNGDLRRCIVSSDGERIRETNIM